MPAAAVLVVELVGVVQREDRVDESPREKDREARRDRAHPGPGPRWPGAGERGENGGQTRERGRHRAREDGDLSLVLLGGPLAYSTDVRIGHGLEGEDQIEPDADVPADQETGRRPQVGQPGEDRHHDTDRHRDK
jgi:hypothetical protein